MTQEIKLKLEEAAGDYGNRCVSRESADGFEAGAQTILENPGEWGLCSLEIHKQAVKTFDKITTDAIEAERAIVDERNQLQSQLAEYRDVLERFATMTQNDVSGHYVSGTEKYPVEEASRVIKNYMDLVNHIAKEALKQEDTK